MNNWRVVVRPEVERDIATVAGWYEVKDEGFGSQWSTPLKPIFATQLGIAETCLEYFSHQRPRQFLKL